MKFGLFYLFSDFGNITQQQLFAEVLEEIEHGEELGFESVWLPEHHFSIYGMLGNPLLLAAQGNDEKAMDSVSAAGQEQKPFGNLSLDPSPGGGQMRSGVV